MNYFIIAYLILGTTFLELIKIWLILPSLIIIWIIILILILLICPRNLKAICVIIKVRGVKVREIKVRGIKVKGVKIKEIKAIIKRSY